MKLKTYRAESMAAALAQVKRDLGKDAVILHTRAFKAGAVLGFGGKSVVEITASDDAKPALAKHPRELVPARTAPPARPSMHDPKPSRAPAAASFVPSIPSNFTPAAAAAPVAALATESALRADSATRINTTASTPAAANTTVHNELAAIRRMVAQVMASLPAGSITAVNAGGLSEPLLNQYAKLIENEVARELAGELVAALSAELSPRQLADEATVHAAMLKKLENLIPVADSLAPAARQTDGRPLILAIIGPTGVGKTTTIAKLAANYGLRQGCKVGLITTDTYRIAAVEQLQTYANIMGMPLKVAQTALEAKAAVQSFSDRDVILIDTAGRSPADSTRLSHLADVLELTKPHETHLALCTTSGQSSLMRTIESFAPLNPNRIILTKLDEATSIGVLLGVLRRATQQLRGAQCSFITTGQQVPADIEPSRPERLARLLLDGITFT